MKNFCSRFLHAFTMILFIILTVNSLCVISRARENQQKAQEQGKEEKKEVEPLSMSRAAVKLATEDVTAFLDGLVPLQMERDDIAGLVIVVVENGRMLFEKGYGYADREKKSPYRWKRHYFAPDQYQSCLHGQQ